MSNPIKYNTLTESLALKKGNFWIGTGDVGKGTTASTGYYDGITPPVGGYTIYLNKASGGPQIHTAANDTQLIALTNIIAGASYTTANECFNYFAGQSDKMVVNREYESIVTNGLVMAMDAGFTASYPKNNTSWYDISSNSFTGTLLNGPSFSSSNGGVLVFDGNDDRCSVSNSIPSLSNLTIELFLNTSVVDSTQNIFFDQFVSLRYEISSGNKFRIHLGSGSGWYFTTDESSTTVVANTWYQTAWTWNGSSSIIYVNGVAENTYSHSSASSGTGSITLGQHTPDTAYAWNGQLGIVRVYNRALSSSEVLQNFNAQKSRFGIA